MRLSLKYKPGSEIAWPWSIPILNFAIYICKLLTKSLFKFIIVPVADKIFSFSTSSPTLSIVGLFNVLQFQVCNVVFL